ncbi:outer membrane beta-barrel protein [Novosphingobium bradum]|uniref:Outer membrane beta-barrel protein n=1 Tax=Novosphingobium bradum TaxID=1737444 RepID=A0ABV7IND7_9SPHN
MSRHRAARPAARRAGLAAPQGLLGLALAAAPALASPALQAQPVPAQPVRPWAVRSSGMPATADPHAQSPAHPTPTDRATANQTTAVQPPIAQSAPRDPFTAAPTGALMRDDVAGARQIPGYTPPGVDLGSFHLSPSLTLRAEASSNVFNRSAQGRGDISATLAPALLATGPVGPARLMVDARAVLSRYARLTGYDADTWALAARGAMPVGRGLLVALNAATARRLEPPYEAAGANAANGGVVLVDQVEAGVEARAELGRTRLTASADLARAHYLPVVQAGAAPLAQAFRDDRAITATLRVDRSLGGGRVLFAQGTWRAIRSLHPAAAPAPAPDRTARAGEAVVGLKGEASRLIMVELAAGYQWRAYRSPALRDYRALAWRARAEWYATPLVTFVLASRRDVVNSPLPAAAGVEVDQLSFKALYEARRNLNLILSGSHAVERYRDLGTAGVGGGAGVGAGSAPAIRSDTVGLEAQYAANRHLMLGLSARVRDRRSASSFLPRQGHAVEGGLWLRFSM